MTGATRLSNQITFFMNRPAGHNKETGMTQSNYGCCTDGEGHVVALPVKGMEIGCCGMTVKVDVSGLDLNLGGTCGVDYSLEEQFTGKRWIDGKKIYQKTVPFGDLKAGEQLVVPHGITDLDQIVGLEGIQRSSDGVCRPMPYIAITGSPTLDTFNITFAVGKTAVQLFAYQMDRSGTGFITIRYIKGEEQ